MIEQQYSNTLKRKVISLHGDTPKNSLLEPQKVKMTPKLGQNQISELKET